MLKIANYHSILLFLVFSNYTATALPASG